MHILFLSDNFPPEVNAPASRTHEHCREWVAAGHQVTVITCAPNFPGGRLFVGYHNRVWQQEMVDGIRVVRVWTYITRNEGFAKRILDYLSFMIAAFVAALFVRRVDIVIGTSPQFFTACAAYAVGLIKRRPWIFELRDVWPESIRAVGASRHEGLLDLLEKVELFLYRRAAAVISVTNAFKTNLVSRGIDPSKISVVTNGVDSTRFSTREKDRNLCREHQLEGRFVAGYIGTLGMAHGLQTLVEAAAIIAGKPGSLPITLVILGDGAERDKLKALAQERRADNILFIDSVPKQEVARYWSILDISVVHLKKTEIFKTVIPSKLFECMAMGVPILLGVEGESAQIVLENGVGWAFEPENAAELAACLERLCENPDLVRATGGRGPAAAACFDRRQLAADMLQLLVNVESDFRKLRPS